MLSMLLFIANLIIKFFNAFAIHKAIGKQAIITKILLTGIFGIFSQSLTQLVSQTKEDENIYSDDNTTNKGNKKYRPRNIKKKFRRHSTDLPHIIDHNDNDDQQTSMLTRIVNIKKPPLDEQRMVYNYELWNH